MKRRKGKTRPAKRPTPLKFRVLGCSGGQLPGYKLSSFLIGDSLLIDAGCTTSTLDLRAQQKIKDILITHIHLDHVMALGTLADNLYGKCKVPINVWSIGRVIDGLAKSLFNDRVWPDFTRITGPTQPVPVLRLRSLREGKATRVGGHTITAIGVGHVVPTVAFLVESKSKALLHIGDTGPTEKIWSFARKHRNLGALVIETSFPNRLQDVADASRHLTPQTLAVELDKLPVQSPEILVTHLKPQFRQEVIKELRKLKGHRLRVLRDGDVLNL
ncbi:MAG TPA: 3',5'-cyclic-nucleotide phosphodiesterase [Candidatus Binatia bacterium]|nr:3',5'-cyclic-nucleotide phosphodiesterase [Candidatus Binatia bacterium]